MEDEPKKLFKQSCDLNAMHWIAKTDYLDYFHQIFSVEQSFISDYPILTYMRYPGLVTIEAQKKPLPASIEKKRFIRGFQYFKGEFDLLNSQQIKKQNEKLAKGKKVRAFEKMRRRMLKTWNSVLPVVENNTYFKGNGEFSVVLGNRDVIVNPDNKSEIFFPVCFRHHENVTGGLLLSAWETNPNLSTIAKRQEFDYFTSGGCLFGNEIFGIDEAGAKHPLTDPNHPMDTTGKIQKIEYTLHRHADEVLTIKTLENLIPLIKLTSRLKIPRVIYHIPSCEYLLNALQLHWKGKITDNALMDYTELIQKKRIEHIAYLNAVAEKYGMEFIYDSPIKSISEELGSGRILLNKWQKIVNRAKDEAEIFYIFLNILSSSGNEFSPIWQHVQSLYKYENEDSNYYTEKSNMHLTTLTYLSYGANLASGRLKNHSARVCSLVPNHEKKVQLTYKQLFSKNYGNILCMNWIPPIIIDSNDFHNGVFFTDGNLSNYIKSLIHLNVVDHIFKGIAGIALDDRDYTVQCFESIQSTLSSIHHFQMATER